MAQVLQVFEVPHPNEALPAEELGLYSGRDGMGQSHLTAAETSWMEHQSTESMLQQIEEAEARRGSWKYLWGNDTILLRILTVMIIAVFMTLVFRLLYKCTARMFERSARIAFTDSRGTVVVNNRQ